MSAVVDIVQEIVEGLEKALDPVTDDPIEFEFLFMPDLEANKFLDKKTDPFVLMEAPLRAKRVVGIGTVDVIYPLRLFFAKKSKLADRQSQRQGWIDLLELAVNEFVLNLSKEDSGLIIVGDVQTSEVHNDFDLNADGWYVNLSVKVEDVIDC